MKRLLSKRWFQVVAGFVLVLMIPLGLAWHFRIWSYRDYQAYQAMTKECHPIWRDLESGRIHAGQDVEEVIASTMPVRVGRFGGIVQLNYQNWGFTGVTIWARDGHLVQALAWSCVWQRNFFGKVNKEDLDAYYDAYDAHWIPIRKQRAEEEAQRAAHEWDGI